MSFENFNLFIFYSVSYVLSALFCRLNTCSYLGNISPHICTVCRTRFRPQESGQLVGLQVSEQIASLRIQVTEFLVIICDNVFALKSIFCPHQGNSETSQYTFQNNRMEIKLSLDTCYHLDPCIMLESWGNWAKDGRTEAPKPYSLIGIVCYWHDNTAL